MLIEALFPLLVISLIFSIFGNLMYLGFCHDNKIKYNPIYLTINSFIWLSLLFWCLAATNASYTPKITIHSPILVTDRAFIRVNEELINLHVHLRCNILPDDKIEVTNHERYSLGLYFGESLEFKKVDND